MYNIIPLILILVSLSVIIIIIIRKFPLLASLDVDNIPAEKEAKVKEQIISSRIKRNVFKWSFFLIKIFKVSSQKITLFSGWLSSSLLELKDRYKSEIVLPIGEKEDKIKILFSEADELRKKGMIREAEKRLIEVIGLDSKNQEAFIRLGELCFEDKNYQEAEQAFSHVLKLMEEEESAEKVAAIYYELALVNKEMEKYDISFNNIKKALAVEQNNPRYLDTMLEISIINKDKGSALDAYKRLKSVNPDNQKLEEFEKEIKEL